MKICLYSPIASHDEYRLRLQSRLWSLKALVKRSLDRMKWRFTSDRTFAFDAWHKVHGTNKGDMAIRLAIRDLFAKAFDSDCDYLEYSWGHLTDDAVQEINRDCDIFVIAGGGYIFTANNGSLGNSRIASDLEFLPKIRCPKIAYGIGANQVLHREQVPPLNFNRQSGDVVTAWLNELDAVAVRDESTRLLLAHLSDKPIVLVGDPALFLESPLAGRAKERAVGINFAVHGPRSAYLFSKHFDKYLGALQALQNRGFSLHYFRHSEEDIIPARMMAAEGIQLKIVDESPRALLSAYSEMDFVLCQMLHSAILASAAGVPTINTAYDRKNFAFYQLLDLEEFCIHEDEFSEDWLFSRISRICDRRTQITDHLAQTRDRLHTQHVAFLHSVNELLVTSPREAVCPTGLDRSSASRV